MQKRNRNNKKNNKKMNKESEDGFIHQRIMKNFPTDVKSNPVYNRVIRFRVGTAWTDKALTMLNIHGFMLFATGVTTAAVHIVNAIRIRRIVIYSVPSVNFGGDVNEISFRWLNLGSFETTKTARGTLSEPAKIVAIPPVDSLMNRAFDGQDPELGTSIAEINMPAESIIDFHVSFSLIDGAGLAETLTTSPSAGLYFCRISLGTLIPDGVRNLVTGTSC